MQPSDRASADVGSPRPLLLRYAPPMVRPDEAAGIGPAVSRCIDLAGGSPVRVSAGAPGSRPRFVGEIQRAERGVGSLRERGEQESGPQRVNAAASSDYQPKGDWEGRAGHVTAKATDSVLDPERALDLPGVWAAARSDRSVWNRRGPTRRPASGEAVRISAEREVARRREGVRGGRSTWEGVERRWREGPLLWSCRWWR